MPIALLRTRSIAGLAAVIAMIIASPASAGGHPEKGPPCCERAATVESPSCCDVTPRAAAPALAPRSVDGTGPAHLVTFIPPWPCASDAARATIPLTTIDRLAPRPPLRI